MHALDNHCLELVFNSWLYGMGVGDHTGSVDGERDRGQIEYLQTLPTLL